MNGDVLSFRPFKIPPHSSFMEKRRALSTEFMVLDLEKSGLRPGDLFSYAHGSVYMPKEADTGYVIPYFYPNGQPIVGDDEFPSMFRIRLRAKANIPCPRYIQPSKDQLLKNGLPGNIPYMPPYRREGDTIYICEGEKKTIAVVKHLGLPAIGIGGCTAWNHPWIFEECAGKKVVLIPDADIQRYDISRAYGGLANELMNRGCSVSIVVPPDKIDDWIMKGNGYDEFLQLPTMDPADLVLSGDALVKKYNLTFTLNKDGRMVPHEHISNIVTLMENHPAFPTIWNNEDNARVYIGDDETKPGHTEVELTRYFQRNLGMSKVQHRLVRDAIGSICIANSRSPMLDWVQGQKWDGKERLASWMIRHWGAEDNEYVREVSVKWMVSSCARMHRPGTKLDWIFIAIGPQGTGKTTMPDILFRGNNMVVYGHDEGKDAKMLLHSALCIGYDELDGMAKREQSTLKAMITCREDAFRKPYAADVKFHKRRSVLYGCGNNPAFLTEDLTGYRRYAIVEIPRKLDFDGLEEEVGQLWAEAWHIYQNENVKYWEVEGANAAAEQYVVESATGGNVNMGLEVMARTGMKTFTSTQLYAAMGLDSSRVTMAQAKDIANTMRNMGWNQKRVKVNGVPLRSWYHE